jgi:hypothetical protein
MYKRAPPVIHANTGRGDLRRGRVAHFYRASTCIYPDSLGTRETPCQASRLGFYRPHDPTVESTSGRLARGLFGFSESWSILGCASRDIPCDSARKREPTPNEFAEEYQVVVALLLGTPVGC